MTFITMNASNALTIEWHLRECDKRFSPRLSDRVEIGNYARKLASLADRFEAWNDSHLVGMVAAYLNNADTRLGFVSNVTVCSEFEGVGLASELMCKCFQLARDKGCRALELEVGESDQRTQEFYFKHGFKLTGKDRSGFLRMNKDLLGQ